MASYRSPGVYVEELPSAIKAIAGVGTSTPGFIGIFPGTIKLVARDPTTTRSAESPNPLVNVDFEVKVPAKTPKLVTNWTQFTKLFGGFVGEPAAASPAAAESANAAEAPASGKGAKGAASGGTRATPSVDDGHRQLAHAVYGFFDNGGSSCYVMRIDAVADLNDALARFEATDEIALVAVPGQIGDTTRSAVIGHCERVGDRFGILDGPQAAADLDKLANPASDAARTTRQASDPDKTTKQAPDPDKSTIVAAGNEASPKFTSFAAWYFPWIKVFDPATKLLDPDGDGLLAVPPSGHIAGIYARVDAERGVFKAPANEAIRGAIDVTQQLSRSDQDQLNPKGVNCIRAMNGNIYVWGARTVGGDNNFDVKYINVRRTLLFLIESIDEGTQWVVFEPNTPALWQKITRNVTAFLTGVWRAGALFGSTQQEAFYVRCDGELNPPEERANGKVVTEIGVAIVQPAEFVIFRISQFSPPGQ